MGEIPADNTFVKKTNLIIRWNFEVTNKLDANSNRKYKNLSIHEPIFNSFDTVINCSNIIYLV